MKSATGWSLGAVAFVVNFVVNFVDEVDDKVDDEVISRMRWSEMATRWV